MGANDAGARVRMIIPSQRQLTLTCKLALLAIDPESGRLRGSIGFGLAAAALLDLTHAGRIALGDPELRSVDERPTGDPILDEALKRIVDEPHARSSAHWVRALGRGRELRERIITKLEGDGVIRRLDERVLTIFPAERYVVVPPRLRAYLVARLRATVLGSPGDATAHDIGLGVLLASIGLFERFFARDERELAELRVRSLMRWDHAGSTAAGAVTEMRILAAAAELATAT